MKLITALVAALWLLTACSAFPTSTNDPDPEALEQSSKVDIHAPFPVTYRAGIEQIKLIELLAGEEEGRRIAALPRDVDDPKYGHSWSAKYDMAFAAFYRRLAGDVEAQKIERNRVQERILGASDLRCRIFKVNLQRDQSRTNFWFGAAGTIAGALGAIAGSAQAAQNLAATSGVLSGVRAEYSQAFYSNLLFSVIIKGIEERRRDAYRQIQQEGQSKPIAAYPAEAAIKDAILYDGLCNTAVGLEQAQDSIRLAADPGQDTLNRILLKANLTRAIMEKRITDPSELEKAGTDLKAGQLATKEARINFGSYLVSADDAPTPQLENFVQGEKAKVEKTIRTTIDSLKYPTSLSADERQKAAQKLESAIAAHKEKLFNRFNACVRNPGADSVKNLLIAQNDLHAAKSTAEKDKAALKVKEEQAKLDVVALNVRQLGARFADGLKLFVKKLDLAKAKRADDVSAQVPEELTKGTGDWVFGNESSCNG